MSDSPKPDPAKQEMRLDEARMGILLAHRSIVKVAGAEERRKLRQLVRMAEHQVRAAETAPTKQIANDCFWRIDVLLWAVDARRRRRRRACRTRGAGMSGSAWEAFDACGACGVDSARACRTQDDTIAQRPCAGRRLRRDVAVHKRALARKKRSEMTALVVDVVREMQTLTEQHQRVMALLLQIKQKQSPKKEGQ